jgi:hypothetical protein
MKRLVYRIVDFLLGLVGDRFEPLNYPKFYACIIDRERVAEVSTNAYRIRARVLEEAALGNSARFVYYRASAAERAL